MWTYQGNQTLSYFSEVCLCVYFGYTVQPCCSAGSVRGGATCAAVLCPPWWLGIEGAYLRLPSLESLPQRVADRYQVEASWQSSFEVISEEFVQSKEQWLRAGLQDLKINVYILCNLVYNSFPKYLLSFFGSWGKQDILLFSLLPPYCPTAIILRAQQ